jgi:hypothetical protein
VVRLLGLEMSGAKFGLRIFLAVVFGALAFAVFYLVPASIGPLAKQVAGPANASAVGALVDSLVSPGLPLVGIAVAALVFVGVFLRGTKAYGPVLVVLGLALLAYVYALFQGGTVHVTIPQLSQYAASGSIAVDLTDLMYLFMVPAVLTLLKGVVLTATKPDGTPAPPSA